jgi:hypothetical protein
MNFKCDIQLPMSWNRIEQARQTVAAGLTDLGQDLQLAAVMVASELAENVVKYGESSSEDGYGHVELDVTSDAVVIRSRNGARAERAAVVAAIIDRIASTDDPLELYADRMRAMLEDPQENSQLGFYRIVSEGQFALGYEYAESILVITATRSLP